METTLHTNSDTLRAVFDIIACGIVVLRAIRSADGAIEDFEYTDANAAATEITGIAREQLAGNTVLSLFPAYRESEHFRAVVGAVETGTSCTAEFPAAPASNEWRRSTLAPLGDGLVVTFGDSSEHKRREATAQSNTAILHNILSHLPLVLYKIDAKGIFTEVAGAGMQRSGTSPERLVGMSVFDIYPAISDSVRRALDGEALSFLAEADVRGETQYYINYCFPDAAGGFTGVAVDVTDQKTAEKELEESKHFIAQIADASPNTLYVFDIRENRTVYVNREITEMLGYSPEEVAEMGSNALALLLHPDDLPRATEHLIAMAQSTEDRLFEIEYRAKHANGEWRWVAARETIFKRDSDGKAILIMGTSQDISQRKRTEEEARSSRHFLERIADVTPGLITVFNCKTGAYLYVSRATESILGYPREPLLEHGMQYFTQFLHPEDLPRVMRENELAIERANTEPEYNDNQIVTFEYRVRHVDGSWRWLQTCGTIFERAADNTVENIINVSIDITERREAESKLRQATEELQWFNIQLEETVQQRTTELTTTEERFRLLSRATNDAIWDWNLVTDEVWWNNGFKTMFGYRDEDIEPDSTSWSNRLHPDDKERVIEGIHKVIESGEIQWSSEYSFRRADGSYATIFDRGYVLHDSEGTAVRMIGSMLDMTAMRAVQEALRKSEEEYRTLATATTQIVWSSSAIGLIEDMPNWREITGQTLEEVRGFGWLDAIHPDDRQRTSEIWQRSAETLSIYEAEYRLRQRDGGYKYFFARGVPILAPDGTVRKWIGTCTDVHYRKMSQEALRRSEERFTIASMVTRDAIWDWNLATNELTYTDNYNTLFGFEPEAMLPTIEEWHRAIHPDDKERVVQSIDAVIESGNRLWEEEYRHRRRDGSYAYVHDRGYVVHDDEGIPVRMVGALSDITERKNSEERLVRSEANLREAQRISHIGNWDFDLATGTISWSEETFRIHGLTPSHQAPDLATLMTFFAEPQELEKRITEAITNGTPYQFDTLLTPPDGSKKYVQIIGQPQLDSTGQCVRMYGTVMDITERKEAEERVHQSKQQLQLITDALPALISYIDSDQRYRFVNKEYANWYGEAALSQIGRTIAECIGPVVYEQVRPYIERVLAGEVVTYDSELRFAAGARHIRAKYVPDIADDGRVRGFIALVLDISEEVQSQEKMRIQARVLESMSEGVSLSDADGFILYTNPAEDAIFGYEPGELIGKHVSVQNAYSEQENERIVGDVIKHLQARGSWSGEFQNIKKDGTVFITHARITSLEMSGKTYWVCVQEDITDEKEAQQALEYQHKITSTITNNATAALFMIDAQRRCTFMNPAAEAMMGYTFAEMRGKVLHDMVHHTRPDGSPYPIEECPIHHVLPSNMEIRGHEDVFVRKDGTFFPVMCSASPITEDGVPLATVLEVRDITEEKKNQAAIRESGERLRAALTASETGTFRWNITTNELDWDDNLDHLFGLPAGEAIQTLANFISRVHPDDREAVVRSCEESVSAGTDFDMEFRVVWPDGSEHWLYDRGKVIFGDNGKPSYMTGACVDITAHKLDQEIIRESAERFRFLADNIPQMVWQAQPDGYIDFFNHHWYSYTGLIPSDSQGWNWEEAIHPDDREENTRAWRYSVATGEPFECEHRIRRRDGTYRWHLGRSQAMRDDDGEIVLWIGTNADIDDQKRFAEELESRVQERTEQLMRSNEQLNRSNAELERFAYVASHDLQEPLRKITTFGERLSTNYYDVLAERGQWYLDSMKNAATRMQALIDDLLSFSRTTRSDEVFERTDLSAIVRGIIDDLEVSIEQQKAAVDVGSLPVIDAVPAQIHQLFQNLISNALKFNDKEQPRISISSETVYGKDVQEMGRAFFFDKFCRITIKDNGIGFDEKYLGKIFIIFQRLHNRAEYEGTGIGLAICKKIVEYHRGLITARSTPGEGAEFIIYLPMRH